MRKTASKTSTNIGNTFDGTTCFRSPTTSVQVEHVLERQHRIKANVSNSTSNRAFVIPDFMNSGITILSLVDLHVFCLLEYIHTLPCEGMPPSFIIKLASACTYNPLSIYNLYIYLDILLLLVFYGLKICIKN